MYSSKIVSLNVHFYLFTQFDCSFTLTSSPNSSVVMWLVAPSFVEWRYTVLGLYRLSDFLFDFNQFCSALNLKSKNCPLLQITEKFEKIFVFCTL